MVRQVLDNPIVEVAEAIGAENANSYLSKGWILLEVMSECDGSEGCFIYALGRPLDVRKD